MTTNRLLRIMGKIARRLIKSNFVTDFTIHDANTINRTNGQVQFIWQVRSTGTWLYLYNEQDWAERLLERIDCYKNSGTCNIYYYFDKKKLVPIFENDVLSIAKKHIELKQKHLQNNMSVQEVLDDALSDLKKTDSLYVKERIQLVIDQAKTLLEKGYDANANYLTFWKEFSEHIL